MAWHIATLPSGLLPLIEGLDKRIGLRNGGFHGAHQGSNLCFHRHSLLPYGGNRSGIQIVFEQEHLIAEGGEDRCHRCFRALHGAHEWGVMLPGLRQLAGTRLPQRLLRVVRQFGFPFLKERLGHLLDGRNALMDGVRAGFGVLRLRGFSLILGTMLALKMHFRLCAESQPPSRLR